MTTTNLDLTGFYVDSTESGLVVTQDTLLDGDISEGVVYINQVGADITGVTGHTFTVSVDTYVDVDIAGTFTYVEVATGAGAPALTADSVRIALVETDGTTITGITDLRTITNLNNYVFGLVDIGVESTMEVYNGSGVTVMIRFGSGSTSGGMPLKTGESRHVTESVYARPLSGGGYIEVTV